MPRSQINASLLTGPPGCGKTTVIRRLVERLGDLRLAGFYTQEIREQGQRVGFEAVSSSGRRALLAHVRSRSRQQVGRYGVEPEQLEPLVREALACVGEVDAGNQLPKLEKLKRCWEISPARAAYVSQEKR